MNLRKDTILIDPGIPATAREDRKERNDAAFRNG